MPRQARKKSESGIYHIILRGINHQQIFEDGEDCQRFVETLVLYKELCGYTLYAYCLMGNHIHILLREWSEELSVIFKRVAGSYVYWYNLKYHRCGHLFQDRFKSEPVDDDAYFLTVLRYIHQNPVKAGLCAKAEEYANSSMKEYLGNSVFVDTSFALSMITKEQFIEYHGEENADSCLEMEEQYRLTDAEAKTIILKNTKCKTVTDFQELDKEKRNFYIGKLYNKGLSIRQIARLTGISKKIVELNIQK